MALEDIFRALDEQAQKECEDILSAARAQADAIAEDAADQAGGICTECVDQTDTAVRLKAAKTTNAAKLEGKKSVAAVKETAMDAAFDKAGARLASIRGTDAYAGILEMLTAEAAAGVTGEMAVLVDPADEALAKQVVAGLGIQAEVRPELSTSGGVVVVTGNGRIVRRNTFEDRLEKVKQTVQSEVAEILFS